ncbi:MAG: hypothetical protein ABI759_26945 [Candidatus Solibacter sp.]
MIRERTIFLSLAAAIVAYQIFVPPVVGLANSGDFGKVIGIFDLTGPTADENGYADTRWEFNPKKHYWAEFYTSEHVLLAAAIAANTMLSKDGYFDLRSIGLIHSALFLVALYLLWNLLEESPRTLRLATWGTALFCFSDVMYVSYLNSFYMDVSAWLFLSISGLLYLRLLRCRRTKDVVWFAICCAMAITSKAQHAILGFWLAGLVVATGYGLWPTQRKKVIAFAACLALLTAAWITKSAPPDYAPRAVFTVAFMRILPRSKDPGRTLRELGLDDSYRRYIGMHAYSEGSPVWDAAFIEQFGRRLTYGGLAWYYLKHPGEAYMGLRFSLNDAGIQRPYLGNFDVHSGYGRFQASQAFSFWSTLKRRVFDQRGPRYFFTFLALAAAVAALLVALRHTLAPGSMAGGAALIGMAFTALAVASLADALDIPRHHLMFYVLFDMLIVVLVYLSVAARYSFRSRKPPSHSS